MGLKFDALNMHGVYYIVKVVFFFCNLEKIFRIFCTFLCFLRFCWGGVENHRLIKIKLF